MITFWTSALMASPILPTASNFSLVFFDPLALAAFSSYPFDTASAGGAGGFSAGGVAFLLLSPVSHYFCQLRLRSVTASPPSDGLHQLSELFWGVFPFL